MSTITVAMAQLAPRLLDRAATLDIAQRAIRDAAGQGARLTCFGEAFAPGYPIWLCRADAARFDEPLLKALHAKYVEEALTIEDGHLADVQRACADTNTWAVLGVIARPRDRGHSLYCSCVTIDDAGAIASNHRKLMPTYEERLAWSPGDGNGLVTHRLDPFTLGSLNCWENWMPLARHALQAQGEDLHVAIWPGFDTLTRDITRFSAREGRSYVVSASGLFRASDIPTDIPELNDIRDALLANPDDPWQNGGSCIARPDGSWLAEPVTGEERLILAQLDHKKVREERQNFDPAGHYDRQDGKRLTAPPTHRGGHES